MDSGGSVSTYALPRGTVLRAYEVSSVLGRGGFGVVYRAIHRELGADVAIKEFFPSELAVRVDQTVRPSRSEHESPFEDGLRRFSEEAKRLEAFRDCPSVVTCRDLFRANGTAYMVMDYIHGLPLSALLERREAGGEPFTQQDLLDVIEPLLAGLQVVHESGVYHRDIKPSNILIRQADNQPVLIDFGAAKQETAGLTKSMAPYTDGYAAMEQVGEGDIGPWTDVYGVGAVMWRIVAGGAPPFEPPNPVPVQRRAYEAMQGESDPMPAATKIGTGRFETSLLETIDACVRISAKARMQNCSKLLGAIDGRGVNERVEPTARRVHNRGSVQDSRKLREPAPTKVKATPPVTEQTNEGYTIALARLTQLKIIWRGVFWASLPLLLFTGSLFIWTSRWILQGHWAVRYLYPVYDSSAICAAVISCIVFGSGIVWRWLALRVAKLKGVHEEGSNASKPAAGGEVYPMQRARLTGAAKVWSVVFWASVLLLVSSVPLYRWADDFMSFYIREYGLNGLLDYFRPFLNIFGWTIAAASGSTLISSFKWRRLAVIRPKLERANIAYKTGLKYTVGKGVQGSDREAFQWYLVAAQKGHADAQLKLGEMYEHGIGVKRSAQQADEWRTKYFKNKYR
ncbi:MAG: serine/threonine-protein kinase [Bacteroidota bacterium]|nr:serine/threonine-protein kinase [Bacteroidota bacterium]